MSYQLAQGEATVIVSLKDRPKFAVVGAARQSTAWSQKVIRYRWFHPYTGEILKRSKPFRSRDWNMLLLMSSLPLREFEDFHNYVVPGRVSCVSISEGAYYIRYHQGLNGLPGFQAVVKWGMYSTDADGRGLYFQQKGFDAERLLLEEDFAATTREDFRLRFREHVSEQQKRKTPVDGVCVHEFRKPGSSRRRRGEKATTS